MARPSSDSSSGPSVSPAVSPCLTSVILPRPRKKGRSDTTPATPTITAFTSTAMATGTASQELWICASKRNSLEMKPMKGGSPAMERLARLAATAVSGRKRTSPPICRRWDLPVAWMALPAQKNSAAL